MARVTVEDCLEELDNRFALVLLAAGRTRQLMKGSRPMVDRQGRSDLEVVVEEILQDKIELVAEEDDEGSSIDAGAPLLT